MEKFIGDIIFDGKNFAEIQALFCSICEENNVSPDEVFVDLPEGNARIHVLYIVK